MAKNEKPKSSNDLESSNKKDALINALNPLCADIKWMEDLINHIKKTPFPETDFEISGLARKISYELIEEYPNLFTKNNPKTYPLKELIIQCLNNTKVNKMSKENIAKKIEEEYNIQSKLMSATKNRSKQ